MLVLITTASCAEETWSQVLLWYRYHRIKMNIQVFVYFCVIPKFYADFPKYAPPDANPINRFEIYNTGI